MDHRRVSKGIIRKVDHHAQPQVAIIFMVVLTPSLKSNIHLNGGPPPHPQDAIICKVKPLVEGRGGEVFDFPKNTFRRRRLRVAVSCAPVRELMRKVVRRVKDTDPLENIDDKLNNLT